MLDFFKNLNLTPEQIEKLQDVMGSAKDNPMAAMAAIQEILPPETIQQLMMMFMQNPQAFTDIAEQAGVPQDQIDEIKGNL